jgi:hypothetical protein
MSCEFFCELKFVFCELNFEVYFSSEPKWQFQEKVILYER